ncbi:MAG: gmhB 3 [Gemmataceae bacterium]|nr:gmhB 3 [Gemmataceae bacterium]
MNPRPAIFLDRDGVVVEDTHYLGSPEQVQLVPGSADAIASLNQAGWPVVVVTNQSGVARGLFTAGAVDAVHAHLSELLAGYGARIEAFYFCPHYPTADVEAYRSDCACRKPKPGMLLRAAADLGLDLGRSWMVGDRASDLEAGAAAGTRTILVRTGYGAAADATTLDRTRLNLEVVASDLADAVAKCGLTLRTRQVA